MSSANVLRMNDATTTVQIHGRDVNVFTGRIISQVDLDCAVQSKIFREWMRGLDPTIQIENLIIQGIYYRAKEPSPDKVLFIMMVASIPGAFPYSIVLRGPTVAILPVFTCGREEYTVGVLQRRPAVGARFYPELLAGMTDGGDIVAKALDELEEETASKDGKEAGIRIRQVDLMALGDYLEPSPGLLSEPMHFFFARIPITRAKLDSFEGRMTGATNEGEEIILKVMPLDHLLKWAPHDMKAEIAYRRYRERFPKRQGLRLW